MPFGVAPPVTRDQMRERGPERQVKGAPRTVFQDLLTFVNISLDMPLAASESTSEIGFFCFPC